MNALFILKIFSSLCLFTSLFLLVSCFDSEESPQRVEGKSSSSSTRFQLNPGLDLWDQHFASLKYTTQIDTWSCNSEEEPVQKLSETYLLTQGQSQDTVAVKHYDDFSKVTAVFIKAPQGRGYYWGEAYDIDSVHWVDTRTIKAYSGDQRAWQEEREYNELFQLQSIKRYSSPEKILIWNTYQYQGDQLVSIHDHLLNEKVEYFYTEGQLVKEWVSTSEDNKVDIIEYQYLEEDGLRQGLSPEGKLVIEQSLDSLGRTLTLKEWDAHGRLHCTTHRYLSSKP